MTLPENASLFAPSNLNDLIGQVIAWVNLNYKVYTTVPPFALEVFVGLENVTSQYTPPAVVWVPLYDDGYEGPQDQPDFGHAIYQTTTVCDIYCWGEDLGQAEELRNAILVALWTLFSPAAIDTSRRAEYSKGLTAGEDGVRIKMQVGITVPILDTVYREADVLTFNEPPPDGAGAGGILVSNYENFADPQPLPP